MTEPAVTDTQRERAIAHLQRQYAQGLIDEEELDRRLDLALGAVGRVQLNSSLQGLARLTSPRETRPMSGAATPMENVASGLVHLCGIVTWFVGPAIVKAVSTPGSRVWWEAGRAVSLQLALGVFGFVSLMLAVVIGSGIIVGLAWLLWMGLTVAASARAFNGLASTGVLGHYLPMSPRMV